MKKRVLFMENDPHVLYVVSELLEMAGYRVLRAETLERAEELLNTRNVHLAICDIRMRDDLDPTDISGLLLAQEEKYLNLPKIILTSNHDYDYVRKALGMRVGGLPPAVDFVAKQEGTSALLTALGNAFAQHVLLNPSLVLKTDEHNPVSLPQLVSAIDPAVTTDLLSERAEELENLFCTLFYREEVIKVERILWQRDRRVALTVFPFVEGRALDPQIVVCGTGRDILEEAERYEEFAPQIKTNIVLRKTSKTLHFAANSYTPVGLDLDEAHSLLDVYNASSEKALYAALETLLKEKLAGWTKEDNFLKENMRVDDLYRERLGLAGGERPRSAFEERVRAILHLLPTLGCTVEEESDKLTFKFAGQSFTYPNPTSYVFGQLDLNQPTLVTYTPGVLTGDNVLVNAGGQVWLTDFKDAGLAPLLWNLVMLEAAIRFDWSNSSSLPWLHELERELVTDEFTLRDLNDVERSLRKPARAIRIIRRFASRVVGKEVLPYYLGIMFHAARRLAAFNPTGPHKRADLVRASHILISAALICSRLGRAGAPSPARGIQIDKENRSVWVDGTRVPMRGKTYDLLLGFYDHANRLCLRRQIIEQFLGEHFDETDPSQVNRLNTAIYRLRERIEADPNHPRFLITEPGGGYRLVLEPYGTQSLR